MILHCTKPLEVFILNRTSVTHGPHKINHAAISASWWVLPPMPHFILYKDLCCNNNSTTTTLTTTSPTIRLQFLVRNCFVSIMAILFHDGNHDGMQARENWYKGEFFNLFIPPPSLYIFTSWNALFSFISSLSWVDQSSGLERDFLSSQLKLQT